MTLSSKRLLVQFACQQRKRHDVVLCSLAWCDEDSQWHGSSGARGHHEGDAVIIGVTARSGVDEHDARRLRQTVCSTHHWCHDADCQRIGVEDDRAAAFTITSQFRLQHLYTNMREDKHCTILLDKQVGTYTGKQTTPKRGVVRVK